MGVNENALIEVTNDLDVFVQKVLTYCWPRGQDSIVVQTRSYLARDKIKLYFTSNRILFQIELISLINIINQISGTRINRY